MKTFYQVNASEEAIAGWLVHMKAEWYAPEVVTPSATNTYEDPRYAKNAVKPPLGIIPEKLWKEQRATELAECIGRYKDNLGNPKVRDWIEELDKLLGEIRVLEI